MGSATGGFVLDSGAIVHGANVAAHECMTPPAVVDEFRPGGATRRRLDLLMAAGLRVLEPSDAGRERVAKAADAAGSLGRLSKADVDVLALTLGHPGARLVTDDHTVLDVARRLGLPTQTIAGPGIATTKDWAGRCSGCGRWFPAGAAGQACPVCGHEVRRKPAPRGQNV